MDTPEAVTSASVDLTLVVPALNEEHNIEKTILSVFHALSSCKGKIAEVLVVDDGSTDRTAAIVERLALEYPPVVLVRNPHNLGLGSSLQLAIARATGRQLLIVPGDNDMPEATLVDLIRHSGEAELVMCYFVNRELRGRMRNFISTIFGLVYTTCFDVFPQYINGPCVYPVAQLKEMRLFSTRFSVVAEINVKLMRQGVSFTEVASSRQTGMRGSSSFSIRNLFETSAIFLRLLYEVHVGHRKKYCKRPIRVAEKPTN